MSRLQPEPPAEVWLYPRLVDGIYEAWPHVAAGCYRYVLAPEGSLVLDPDMARVFTDWLHAEESSATTEVTLDFRGGAS